MSNKIGALVIDLQGLQLTADEAELLSHPLVGGIILFARNYDNPSQLRELCRAVRASRAKPILIMVDQEGGKVQRFRNHFFSLPSLSFFGEWYDKNPSLGLELAKSAGWLMASEVLAAGVDISLAPVIDLNKNNSLAIGSRAFHADPEIVYLLAHAYIDGMREAGMTATIKHFPGHGSVQVDSHLEIPIDPRSLQDIFNNDIKPFQQLINTGVHAVMAAHIKFPQIDDLQVSFSRIWLHEILRKQLKFTGTIMSDDLNMQGANISANYADRVRIAREAGCDFALLCNNREAVIQSLDHLPHEQHQLTIDKWQTLQANFSHLDNIEMRTKTSKDFLQTHMDTLQNELITNSK